MSRGIVIYNKIAMKESFSIYRPRVVHAVSTVVPAFVVVVAVGVFRGASIPAVRLRSFVSAVACPWASALFERIEIFAGSFGHARSDWEGQRIPQYHS